MKRKEERRLIKRQKGGEAKGERRHRRREGD